jgi:anti-anti-sigma factor
MLSTELRDVSYLATDGYRDPGTSLRQQWPLAGELDMATAGPVLDGIRLAIESGSGPLDLDLSQLEFIDASGLRVLVQAYKHAGRRGRPLGLVNVPAKVARVLHLGGIAGLFAPAAPAHPDPETQLAILADRYRRQKTLVIRDHALLPHMNQQ